MVYLLEYTDMKARFAGKVLAAARHASGMDQAELARLVSRNRVTISDIERGKLQPGYELADSIARVLGLEVESLYETPSEASSPAGSVNLTIEEIQVIDAMRRSDPVVRAKIWAFAQGLAAGRGSTGATAAAELAETIEKVSRSEQAKSDTHADTA